MPTVGERVRTARLAQGLTQLELAGREYTRGWISQIETGKINPSLSSLGVIAARLGKPITWFLEGSPHVELTAVEVELLGLFRECNEENRNAVLAFTRWQSASQRHQ